MDTFTLIERLTAASQNALARSDLDAYTRFVAWIPAGDEQDHYEAIDREDTRVCAGGVSIGCVWYNWRCRSCRSTWASTAGGHPIRAHEPWCPVLALENPSDATLKRLCDQLLLARRAAQGTDEIPSVDAAVAHIKNGGAWIVFTKINHHLLIDDPGTMRELLEHQATQPHTMAHRRYLAIKGGMAVVPPPNHKEQP